MYNYVEGKKRIKEIMSMKLDIDDKPIPQASEITYENAYYGWVSAIFVDIIDSSNLFTEKNKTQVSKVIKSFASEVIEILRENDNLREIGVRGDCVYAVYSSPSKDIIYDIFEKTFWINTFMRMLNKLLSEDSLPNISAGIGISTAQELVVRAGRKHSGLSDIVWIGKAVTKASHLSSISNRNGAGKIAISDITYTNIIDQLVKNNGADVKNWFTYKVDSGLGNYYYADIIKLEFNKWIEEGMK